ncbi:YajQ family cyclic di-GMP-binding protein [Methylophilaceae bacterium]|jgi:cyclic-di-GMP-binding protein|nr:YajQ family cyclic di-GMP-binding protein [Methylophilaceae bacterium]
MPSFDITSEANLENIRNAVDVSMRMIDNRYDFKGTTAKIDFLEKEMVINLFGDAEFQLNQIKDILFPAMEKKEPDSSKRITSNIIESVSGNKSKQVLEIKSGIDMDLAKKIVKTIKDSKSKTQANIQGDSVRVSGGKRDILQECIALVKAKHNDFPLNFGNFRD